MPPVGGMPIAKTPYILYIPAPTRLSDKKMAQGVPLFAILPLYSIVPT